MALAALPAAVAHADTTPAAPTAVVGATTPQAAQGVAAELRRHGLSVTAIPRIGALEVSGDDLAAVRAAVGRDPRVDWVEASRDRSLFSIAPPGVDEETGRTYGWSVDSVRATEALAMTSGLFPTSVAVIDSGIDVTHPDLAGRIGPTYDVLTRGTGVRDVVGHGTFVAGLISAIDGNGLGARGVAGATRVLPIRITTTGTIKSSDAAEGIIRAVNAGAGVINLSFGGATISEVEKSALAYAAKRDVLVVAAAGNSYQVTSPVPNPVQYPAAALGGVKGGWGQGLSVAATDPLGRRARFSTTNDFVSVAAPGAGSGECGDGVFSTIPAASTLLWDDDSAGSCTRVVGELSTPQGRYGYAEGTSFATPLVSGAAALARDVNPGLTAEQTADVIRRSARQTVGTGWNAQTGWGVLDVAAAVGLARTYDTIEPVPALTVLPRVGSLSVTLGGTDVAGPGSNAGRGRDVSAGALEQRKGLRPDRNGAGLPHPRGGHRPGGREPLVPGHRLRPGPQLRSADPLRARDEHDLPEAHDARPAGPQHRQEAPPEDPRRRRRPAAHLRAMPPGRVHRQGRLPPQVDREDEGGRGRQARGEEGHRPQARPGRRRPAALPPAHLPRADPGQDQGEVGLRDHQLLALGLREEQVRQAPRPLTGR